LLVKEEPKDRAGDYKNTGVSQILSYGRFFIYNVTEPGRHPLLLEQRTDDPDDESSTWNAIVIITKIY